MWESLQKKQEGEVLPDSLQAQPHLQPAHLRRKWRVGDREEERERESVLEEELWSFMKTLRLPNLAKLLPRARPAPPAPGVPRWDWAPPPLVVAPAPLGGWRLLGASHRFFLGLSATGSRVSLRTKQGRASPTSAPTARLPPTSGEDHLRQEGHLHRQLG